ncbi:MAG: UPF0175 family protein [Acidobacteria bacterium]|nr:UPF0175 family protein [Acidobacteriota bacterium]
MNITISLPDSIAQYIGSNEEELRGRLLESFAIEGYRSEKLTAYEVGRLLGLETRMEIDEFLKKNGLFLDYTEEELETQRRGLEALLNN